MCQPTLVEVDIVAERLFFFAPDNHAKTGHLIALKAYFKLSERKGQQEKDA